MDKETTQCENCRIEITTKGITVDSSEGNLYFEATILVTSISRCLYWQEASGQVY